MIINGLTQSRTGAKDVSVGDHVACVLLPPLCVSLGNGAGRSTTADFLAGLVGSLPRLHELAQQAGIDLPPMFGKVNQGGDGHVRPVATSAAKPGERDGTA